MQGYIGYIRVSTVKQGTQGVSLQEQRDAISRYANQHQFTITTWLEEMETAAKQGRPVFNQALKLLRTGKAQGIILHKLDRGARNLRDWAAIGELSDQGVEVHFVNESIDLQTRGGRLSADIQAVVAADYIRNLREETRKGFYGRLKQGLYPLQAPIGYVDRGKAQPKTIDPVMGPLVRQVFELYGSGRFSLEALRIELEKRGLRQRKGGSVNRNSLSVILNNPFYMGLIRIRKTDETFSGIHAPLVTRALFDRVQAVLSGKCGAKTQRHVFLFRRMVRCATCEYSLIGERQKGHAYYRCHTRACPATSFREEDISVAIEELIRLMTFNDQEKEFFKTEVKRLKGNWESEREAQLGALKMQLGQAKERLSRLTDAYLDQVLDKELFEQKKKALLLEQKTFEEQLARCERSNGRNMSRVEKFLELAGNAWLSYQMAIPEEKREMLKTLTSNWQATAKNLELKLQSPFHEIANRNKISGCPPQRDRPRTCGEILGLIIALNKQGKLPDLATAMGCGENSDSDTVWN